MTDTNLFLGRLIPEYFPKIFGKNEDEMLDEGATSSAFEGITKEVNSYGEHEGEMGLDEIVYGCVAFTSAMLLNEAAVLIMDMNLGLSKWRMRLCAGLSVRLQRQGDMRLQNTCTSYRSAPMELINSGNSLLASFGGAGGQHACEIAQLLGIKTILIHRYCSILSAYGLTLADRCVPCRKFHFSSP